MNPITSRPPLPTLPSMPTMPGTEKTESGVMPFLDLMAGQVKEVNGLQSNADVAIHEMLTGGDVDSVEVLTAVQKAGMAFRLMQQIRNKLVDAYREINQMQI